MCNCCGSSPPQNKVLPEEEAYVQTAQYGRVNGWSCPLHPLQIIGWFLIILFAITHFGILVYYLPMSWQGTGVIIPLCGYVIHFVYHFLALTLDPADPAVRKKGTFLRRLFDKTKHMHVIENSFCYICQTQVSSRSKHCSKCNKCVAEFDHHCMWLNNCVGGRNYILFLGSCISAFLTALVMFIIDFHLMIVYYTARPDVLGKSSMNDWKLFVPVCKEAYIIFVIVNGLLLFIAMLLLGHLLIFHSYLCCKKMTTYDYVIRQRNSQISKDGMHSDVESVGEAAPPPIGPLSSSHSNGYTEDVKHAGAIQMQRMEASNILYVDGAEVNDTEKNTLTTNAVNQEEVTRISGTTTPNEMGPGVVEEHMVSTAITNVYEAPPAEKPVSATSKSKSRSLKHRSSSRVELIKNSDDENGSLSSARSLNSVRSVDTKMEQYAKTREENVLEGFASPRNNVESKTRPVQLTEETAYANLQMERNESAADRPHSPSPKPSQRISFVNQQNDYVMRVNNKHSSNSSLSTLALQDHDDRGKVLLSPARLSHVSKSNLSPTREESLEGGKRSSTSKTSDSVLSSRKIEVASINGDENEEPMLLASPTLSLSNRPLARIRGEERTPRHSEVSEISLSEAVHSKIPLPSKQEEQKHESSPRNSVVSTMTNLTLTSERFPVVPSETELTHPVPDEEKPKEKNADGLVLTKALSEDESTLIFEDQFVTANDGNIDFLHQSLVTEERRMSPKKSPNMVDEPPKKAFTEPGVISDADSHKLASYVDAFKRKKRDSDQYSFGSDTGGSDSGVPIAVLNEEADTFALKDSLQRVKKLSDAFPTAIEQDKRDALPHPRFRSHQSMSELSVVEYNRRKKLKKKRPSSSSTTTTPKQKQLPPLRGRKPLAEVMEEKDRNESDV